MMNNKLQIIETSDYILAVSDEEVKLSNDNIGFFLRTHSISNNLDIIQNPSFTSNYKYKKIIAYKPKGNAPELDLPLLPPLTHPNCCITKDGDLTNMNKGCAERNRCLEMIVEDDVKKLAYNYRNTVWKGYFGSQYKAAEKGFIDGYKAATKVYSENDLYIAFSVGRTYEKSNHEGVGQSELIDYIQTLKQPKTPKWFVAEIIDEAVRTKEDVNGENAFKYVSKLKTTTINGEIYLVGTYKYE